MDVMAVNITPGRQRLIERDHQHHPYVQDARGYILEHNLVPTVYTSVTTTTLDTSVLKGCLQVTEHGDSNYELMLVLVVLCCFRLRCEETQMMIRLFCKPVDLQAALGVVGALTCVLKYWGTEKYAAWRRRAQVWQTRVVYSPGEGILGLMGTRATDGAVRIRPLSGLSIALNSDRCLASPSAGSFCARQPVNGWVWCEKHIPPRFACTDGSTPQMIQMYDIPLDVVAAGYFEDRWCTAAGMICAQQHFMNQVQRYMSLRRRVNGWTGCSVRHNALGLGVPPVCGDEAGASQRGDQNGHPNSQCGTPNQ